MGFSIIAAALGGIVTIVYSLKIYFITSYGFQNNDNYRTKLAIIVILKLNLKKPVNTKRILISTAATACFTGGSSDFTITQMIDMPWFSYLKVFLWPFKCKQLAANSSTRFLLIDGANC